MTTKRKRKPRVIHIHGRRWFERVNGNTYHTCAIFVDGDCVTKTPFAYGYGTQYEWTAREWLCENGYCHGIGQHENGSGEPLWRYCERMGIKLVNEVDDVARRRDL